MQNTHLPKTFYTITALVVALFLLAGQVSAAPAKIKTPSTPKTVVGSSMVLIPLPCSLLKKHIEQKNPGNKKPTIMMHTGLFIPSPWLTEPIPAFLYRKSFSKR